MTIVWLNWYLIWAIYIQIKIVLKLYNNEKKMLNALFFEFSFFFLGYYTKKNLIHHRSQISIKNILNFPIQKKVDPIIHSLKMNEKSHLIWFFTYRTDYNNKDINPS